MFSRVVSAFAFGAALALTAGSAQAVTYDLQSGGDSGTLTSGDGNTLTIEQSGHTLIVSGYYENSGDALSAAEIQRFSSGIGVCNPAEGNCPSPSHTVDNANNDEWVLFVFDTVATIDSVYLSQFGDTDVEWFVGTANIGSSSLLGLNSNIAALQGLSGASGIVEGSSSGNNSNRTVTINAVGNFLLLGPDEQDSNDAFKIKNIKATFSNFSNIVPEPATWGLMICGFAGLAFATRRRTAAA